MGSRSITVNAVAPGYIATDMTKDLPEELKQKMLAADPAGPHGQARRHRRRREVPGQRRRRLHHRPRAGRQRRHVHVSFSTQLRAKPEIALRQPLVSALISASCASALNSLPIRK